MTAPEEIVDELLILHSGFRMIMSVMLLHLKNASAPMLLTLAGIVTFFSPMQPSNA